MVDSAIALAFSFGISEAVVGLTIVAIGTSLPEFATSVVAAHKRKTDIAVGNIIGSNIFNLFFILGISAIIRPLPFSPLLTKDVLVTVLATLFLFLFMFVGKKHVLEKWQGTAFFFSYLVYIFFLIFREIAK